LKRNPKLVYGRMTGWGQFGPLAQAAGHDINYIAITGALAAIGLDDKPIPPLNLVGDFGGGALYLAFGLLAGIISARTTGQGQVVDCAMTDGAASLMSMFYGMLASGAWREGREANLLDGGAHFYGTYKCKDDQWVSLGSIEPQFYALLVEKAGLADEQFKLQMSREDWPALKAKLTDVIKTKTRDEWTALMEGTDVCFGPVMGMREAASHPHNAARETFVTIDGVVQPAPAPRFSATPGAIQAPPPAIGADNEAALADWGFAPSAIEALQTAGAL
jgi:alpha-methylacyl-CoA racemase